MFHIVLYEPEIPPNTGNVIRLCANCGSHLHLIKPLSFDLSDKKLRRAGLDYHEISKLTVHDSLNVFLSSVQPRCCYACSTKGKRAYSEVTFQPGDAMIFGPETRGLPSEVLDLLPAIQVLRVPMLADSRSLNLSNAVAIIVYEAWRQNGFS